MSRRLIAETQVETHSNDGVVKRHVTDSELLVPQGSSDVTAVEDKVAEETTGAVLHVNTYLVVVQLEHEVYQGCGLGHLPVDSGVATGSLAEIEDDVTDGA